MSEKRKFRLRRKYIHIATDRFNQVILNTSVVSSNWRDRIGTVHSYLYKQFRIALNAGRDDNHGYFNVSGKIRFSETDAVPAMNFFISSPGFRTAEDDYAAEKKMLKHGLTKRSLGSGKFLTLLQQAYERGKLPGQQ